MRKKLFALFAFVVSAALFAVGASAAPAAKDKDELDLYAYTVADLNVVNPETGRTLRGRLYRPVTAGRTPLAICAHELGSNYARRWPQYGKSLASHGAAVYTFDFAGGGPKERADGTPGSHSDGETTEMSVMTEVKDLEAVLAAAKTWDFVDSGRIALIGGSQGGAVSVVAAARHAGDFKTLVLLYPALLIRDDLHKKFASADACPPVYKYNGWLDVSPVYVKDMWDYDLYVDMPKYDGPVLILHGDRDEIVPMSYSERAAAARKNTKSGGRRRFPCGKRRGGFRFSFAVNPLPARAAAKFA
ncbi:alpha/beta hydrolase family protein [Pyramidobacter porci]|nr:alpha/beta fold hydrolase [Pyramidobacter porci]